MILSCCDKLGGMNEGTKDKFETNLRNIFGWFFFWGMTFKSLIVLLFKMT